MAKGATVNSKGKTRAKAVSVQKARVDNSESSYEEISTSPKISKKKILLVLGVIILLGLLFYFRSLLAVAIVNGEPITRFEVVKELEHRYGRSIAENLITEKLILQEAKKQNIQVTQKEVDEETAKLEKRFKDQGQDFDQLLSTQGITKDDLSKQLRVQKLIEKIIEKEITVSDKEIEDYVKSNKDTLFKDKKPEEATAEAKETLKQQKLNEKFNSWIEELKAKAKIDYFLRY